MPYTMALYPDEDCAVPDVGDTFVVVRVDDDVLDMHWGRCVNVELEPREAERVQEERRDG